MPVTRSTVTNELLQVLGPAISREPLFETLINIGLFLGNVWDWKGREKMTAALAALDADMANQARLGPKHVLTTVLTNFEEARGFSVVTDNSGRKRGQLYLSFLPPELFLAQLRAGYHWKDPTVSPEHGEFTHRLQWYLLIHAGVLGQGVAARDVMDVCGRYQRTKPPLNALNRESERTDLWEMLFDRDTKDGANSFLYPLADSDGDFRNPNNLNRYLRGVSSQDDLRLPPARRHAPLLQDFLKARFTKRSTSQDAYFLKKKYPGKSEEDLDTQQQVLYYKYVMAMSDEGISQLCGVTVSKVQEYVSATPPIL
ncbi:LirA/MavJ family T4SS effector [Corallococcus aberystwythensis]|uniref:DUF5636 domain-containing protein n=1 Tax=Corallococcus aberystwythensis TaxID=2316722 RepID=A0A3A8R5K3_9BACT|nr:LirA/MavJ family T4SS effector [Corallococcus aberystwythensis]RKH74470.1 hypothetical protein D7W81_01520 [Corallococcus aberystwythensis]